MLLVVVVPPLLDPNDVLSVLAVVKLTFINIQSTLTKPALFSSGSRLSCRVSHRESGQGNTPSSRPQAQKGTKRRDLANTCVVVRAETEIHSSSTSASRFGPVNHIQHPATFWLLYIQLYRVSSCNRQYTMYVNFPMLTIELMLVVPETCPLVLILTWSN